MLTSRRDAGETSEYSYYSKRERHRSVCRSLDMVLYMYKKLYELALLEDRSKAHRWNQRYSDV